MSLKDIPIAVQAFPEQQPGEFSGMAQALLEEICDQLETVCREGGRHVVELTNLPITPQDLSLFAEFLGTGEVTASIEASGKTEVRETGYSGVWWIRYLGSEGNVITEQLEIASIPLIVTAHPDDMRSGAARLRQRTREENAPVHTTQ